MNTNRFRTRDFSGITLRVMLSGSAVLGGYEPEDVDYIVDGWMGGYKKQLKEAGYENCWTLESEEYPDSLFHAYRKGNINLIFAVNPIFTRRWVEAHDFCLNHPDMCETKDERIAIFQYFRSPEDKGVQRTRKIVEIIQENDRLKKRNSFDTMPF